MKLWKVTIQQKSGTGETYTYMALAHNMTAATAKVMHHVLVSADRCTVTAELAELNGNILLIKSE